MNNSKKILVLGCTGMLGHKLYQKCKSEFDTYGTTRWNKNSISKYNNLYNLDKIVTKLDLRNITQFDKELSKISPEIVINAVGIIKQIKESKNKILTIKINSVFPHEIVELSRKYDFKVVHFSTDCVFRGDKGNYTEEDIPDAIDLYGRTKILGEIENKKDLTIRCSIIGRELKRKTGLLEWFLAHENKSSVKGYTDAYFTGLTTLEMGNVIVDIIKNYMNLNGLYHITGPKISKYELLNIIKSVFNMDIEIEPYNKYKCDRSLIGEKFKRITDYKSPSWKKMIEDIYYDKNIYKK